MTFALCSKLEDMGTERWGLSGERQSAEPSGMKYTTCLTCISWTTLLSTDLCCQRYPHISQETRHRGGRNLPEVTQ